MTATNAACYCYCRHVRRQVLRCKFSCWSYYMLSCKKNQIINTYSTRRLARKKQHSFIELLPYTKIYMYTICIENNEVL